MKNAIKKVINPVSASALTTIAGLIALLFMTFTIGFDIGIVLVKGIVISGITSLTLLPALILVFEKPMDKTSKKEFVPKGAAFCRLAFKGNKIIIPVAVVLVISCGILQSFNTFGFTDVNAGNEAIQEAFGQNNTVVVVYGKGNNDYANEKTLADRISLYKNEDGKSVLVGYTAYSNTVREEYDIRKAVRTLGLSESDAVLLYTMYHLNGDASLVKMSFADFSEYADFLIENDDDAKAFIDEETAGMVKLLNTIGVLMENENTAEEFHSAVVLSGEENISMDMVKLMYSMYFMENGESAEDRIQGRVFVSYIINIIKQNSLAQAFLPPETLDKLDDMMTVDSFYSDTAVFDYNEMYTKINELQAALKSVEYTASLSTDKISGVYIKYSVSESGGFTSPVVACELLEFVKSNMDTNDLLKAKISEENRKTVNEAEAEIKKAEELFIGENHSRMLIYLDIPTESEKTTDFVKYLSSVTKEVFGEDSYVAGEIVSTYDLSETFDGDNTLISIFTIVSIFVIVMLIFRSLSIPVILVAVIQGSIWISLSTSLIGGNSIFFMSYIMANCILMGATIDYGILMSSNYVNYRMTLDKKEALYKSVEAAMPTVFTSGVIMSVCGFVISFIASQNAISSVGLLIGKGTLVSVAMITLVLPSALYLLDGFILKLSLKKK